MLKQYGNDPKTRDICQQLNAIINGDLSDDKPIICFVVASIIIKIYEIMRETDDLWISLTLWMLINILANWVEINCSTEDSIKCSLCASYQ